MNIEDKLKELEKRIEDLERRPIYIPVYPYPQEQDPPRWQDPTKYSRFT